MRGIFLLITGAFLAHGLALGELFSLLEGLGLPPALRAALGWGRAAATAAVLSFSSASLAKQLVQRSRGGTLPVFLWIAESVLLVILIAPLLVFQLRRSPLIEVISTPAGQWLVCVAAVLAIEISVAGGMFCQVQHTAEIPEPDDEIQVQLALQEALWERAEMAARATSGETVKPGETGETSETGGSVKPTATLKPAATVKRHRPPAATYHQILTLLRQGLSGRQTARETGVSPATVSRYRQRAMAAGELEA
jgi:hypothetical protein